MSAPASRVEAFLDGVDTIRGLLFLLFIGGIGVVSILSGGLAGWAVGIGLLGLAAWGLVSELRRIGRSGSPSSGARRPDQ